MNLYVVNLNLNELQAKDRNADIAHYFDVIGGTSTGGLITAMLATPNPHQPNLPAFTPAQIVDFYKQNGPHIFNESRYNNINILTSSPMLIINNN